MKIRIACGTDDEKNFSDNHFGDSKYFLIYEYDPDSQNIEFIKKIKNNFRPEANHGDVKKAGNISIILKGISVLAAFVMGPNISVMRKKFVPLISRKKNILKSLSGIKEKKLQIIKEAQLPEGKDRKIFIIN